MRRSLLSRAEQLVCSHPTRCMSTQKVERVFVGEKLEAPKDGEKYYPGQPFVHRLFGYRGVILRSWSANLYDRNTNLSKKSENDTLKGDDPGPPTPSSADAKPLEFSKETYYQALIHAPDVQRVSQRIHPIQLTYLNPDQEPALGILPGHDYLHHDEVVAYKPLPKLKDPFDHGQLNDFFDVSPTPTWHATPKHDGNMWEWLSTTHWLQMRNVHQEVTEGVRVTVTPFYLGKRTANKKNAFYWRYIVRMENLLPDKVLLRKRHWKIFSLAGHMDTEKGSGVTGDELEPVLSSYQYSDYVTLPVPGGHMWGCFVMERKDGSLFEVRVPAFALERNHALGK